MIVVHSKWWGEKICVEKCKRTGCESAGGSTEHKHTHTLVLLVCPLMCPPQAHFNLPFFLSFLRIFLRLCFLIFFRLLTKKENTRSDVQMQTKSQQKCLTNLFLTTLSHWYCTFCASSSVSTCIGTDAPGILIRIAGPSRFSFSTPMNGDSGAGGTAGIRLSVMLSMMLNR